VTGKAFIHRNSEDDFFETPYRITHKLFEHEEFDFNFEVLEPACGYGAITRILQYYFDGDINYYDKYKGSINKDFFDETKKYKYVITNPPYKIADEFVLKAKEIYNKKFAFFLRTNYLSGQKRYNKKVYDSLKNVYIFNRMPDLSQPLKESGLYKTAGIVYAWLVWEKGWKGKPMIEFLDCSMDIDRNMKGII